MCSSISRDINEHTDVGRNAMSIAKHAKPARQRIFKHWLCTVARKHLQMRLIRWQAAAAMLEQQQNGTRRAKFAKKVHKPPLGVNVIDFELNGFNASIWVPWSSSDLKK